MIKQCHLCHIDTAGQHEYGCLVNDQGIMVSQDFRTVPRVSRIGWECAVCGCSYAPHVAECWRCNKNDRVFDDVLKMFHPDETEEVTTSGE